MNLAMVAEYYVSKTESLCLALLCFEKKEIKQAECLKSSDFVWKSSDMLSVASIYICKPAGREPRECPTRLKP